MTLDDFKNIDFKNAANLPLPVKGVLLAGLMLIVLFFGYWFVWSSELEELDQAKNKETELRNTFLDKKRQAVNLDAYKQQMMDVEHTFGTLLKQLPDRSQMDGLLTDINQAGLSHGLEFLLFKPSPEVVGEFYAEMPISIKVLGNYHNVGAFASEISKLSRIVTLNDINISESLKDPNNKDTKDGRLMMEAVAKTYRYLDASEVASKKKADVKRVNQ